jgi:pimeloyl-ACP methyl ester carboxylesterase
MTATYGLSRSERPLPPLPGTRHSWLRVDGVVHHVAESGDIGRDPVVLLHGFPQHWYAWRRVVPLLAKSYRVVCPDLVGYGWSDAPRAGYGTAARARSLFALLDALGLERVALVGHEAGGWLSLVMGLEFPERITRLVALNIPPPWASPRRLWSHAWQLWYTAIVEQPLLGRAVLHSWPGFTRFLLRHNASAGAWDDPTLDEFAAAMAAPGCARAAEIQHRRFVFEDIPALLTGRYRRHKLTVPTLLVGGDADRVFPPSLFQGAQRGADDVRVVTLPGGHYLPEECPDAVAREILGFCFVGQGLTTSAAQTGAEPGGAASSAATSRS